MTNFKNTSEISEGTDTAIDYSTCYAPLSHGSLFSGIGGFDLAAEWAGYKNIFHCEWNDFGKRILQYYWPKAISYDDITKTDFTIHRGKIDILTGGFPCQPYSVAGKRKGTEDDRHLWPEMLRAIREIQPSWIVGENVSGLINWSGGLVFEEVQTDLENEGYEVWANVLPAASVGAPHKRDRVWFVAYNNSNGQQSRDGDSKRNSEGKSSDKRIGKRFRSENISNGNVRDVTDTFDKGLQRSEKHRSVREGGKDRNKFFTGCVPPAWEKFPTQSPICDGDDGLSSRLDAITFSKWRTESVKGGGNAIVPQVAFQIFKAINEFRSSGA